MWKLLTACGMASARARQELELGVIYICRIDVIATVTLLTVLEIVTANPSNNPSWDSMILKSNVDISHLIRAVFSAINVRSREKEESKYCTVQ